jgi:glutathione S-transferase
VGPIIAHGAARVHGADDSQLLEDVRAVPDVVAHVNRAIDEGTIGGGAPNAADLQIAPSIRLMLTFDDLKPMIERTPAGELARRLFPDWAGHAPAGTIPTPMVPSSAPA